MTTFILRREDFADSDFFDSLVEEVGCEHTPNADRNPLDELTLAVVVKSADYREEEPYEDEPDVDEAQEWADFDPDC